MERILILTNSINGLYNFRRELVLKLLNDFEVIIAAPHGEKMYNFTKVGCTFIETPIKRRGTNPFIDFMLLIKYWKIIVKFKPAVVLTYTIKPNIYGGFVCSILDIPYISNITGLGTAVENKGLLQRFILILYRLSFKKASCVFFQNEENRQFMINNKVALNNNRLIPGSGVNLQHFKLLDYPSSDKKINFLFIARVMKEKGIDYYLEAAQYIKAKYPNTEFHVLGDCEEDYLEKLNTMQKKGIINYHGRQDDVRKFHKISHCTIHPTYYPEGMSNALLESAASGRPIITTNRSGCREIVDNGINGFLVEPKNSEDLIDKIEAFLALSYQEKKSMGLAGRTKVEKQFDREIVIKEYINEINKIINNNAGISKE